MITEADMKHLRRCVELAEIALEGGNQPFGSVLVSSDGKILAEDYNRISSGDYTRHPEFALARWATKNMSEEEREKATVYTSGEHCPMCAAAHGYVGLGRIVYVSSSIQFTKWLGEFGIDASQLRVQSHPIQNIIRDTEVEGPVQELADEVRELHRQYYEK